MTDTNTQQAVDGIIDELVTELEPAIRVGLDALSIMQQFVSGLDAPIDHHKLSTFALALIIEVSEFVQETNWKPWKPEKELDKERLADEFADILAFLGILLEMLNQMGLDATAIASAYTTKSRVNVARFTGRVDGYKK